MGNPFLEDTAELLMLDTRDVLHESVVTTVRTVEKLGMDRYEDYYKAVTKNRTTSIHELINKNSLSLFRCPVSKSKSKQAGQITMLKHNVELFSRLYIVMQHREGDMSTFFKHENHPFPPSLSDRGKLRLGKKSDLLSVLPEGNDKVVPVSFDFKVLDGAAIVHLLQTNSITTFDDYATDVFIPYINRQLDTAERVDVVWDSYVTRSIKESTREKRGKGMRRKVAGKNKFPSDWLDFLHDATNKQELFNFLSHKIELMMCRERKQVFTTSGTSVIARGTDHHMKLCNHEEADTRMLVHLLDVIANGATTSQLTLT